MTNFEGVYYFITIIIIFYASWEIFNRVIFPKMVTKGMKELDRNPKWITSQLQYYGFHDIDIILCKSKWGMLPRFRVGKNDRLELWIDNDTSTKDVEEIGRLALLGKLKVKYGVWYEDKPIHWLSVLCYMLDGGNVTTENVEWKQS